MNATFKNFGVKRIGLVQPETKKEDKPEPKKKETKSKKKQA